jgi:pimeloyl-ACP methyl ester carboxylesterase
VPIVEANGLKLDCEVHGAADAPVVLLVMGLGMPAALWPDPVVEALTGAGFRVVTFDNRDAGGSTRLEGVRVPNVLRAIGRALLRRKVSAPYTLEDMAADTVGLLDALGIAQAHVVGASMGGMIGQVVAARHPARVLSLTSIMSNSGNPGRRYAFGSWKALRALIHPPPPPDDHEAVVRHLMRLFSVIGGPNAAQDVELARPVFQRVARKGLYRAGTLRQLLAILATADRRPLLQQITAPTLVLHGADDPLVPVLAGRDTAASVRGAQLEEYAGMGHDFPPALLERISVRVIAHCRAAQPRIEPAAAEASATEATAAEATATDTAVAAAPEAPAASDVPPTGTA